jgi:hypothetical protein
MKNIKLLSLMILLGVGALLVTSCTGTDDPVTPTPILNFLADDDAGYLTSVAELSANTAFKVAITASHTDNITSFKIIQSLDGSTDLELFDSLEINTKVISEYIFEGVTGANAGTEIYSFIVADKDGNSTTKQITITNLGDPGKDLFRFELDNGGNPFKVWNFIGPLPGAFGITAGANFRSGEDDADKDIQDAAVAGETWNAKWTSRNGTTFKKLSGESWNTVTNDATIVAAWENGGVAESEITVEENEVYILNLAGSGNYGLVLITAIDKTVPNSEFVQLEFKKQDI